MFPQELTTPHVAPSNEMAAHFAVTNENTELKTNRKSTKYPPRQEPNPHQRVSPNSQPNRHLFHRPCHRRILPRIFFRIFNQYILSFKKSTLSIYVGYFWPGGTPIQLRPVSGRIPFRSFLFSTGGETPRSIHPVIMKVSSICYPRDLWLAVSQEAPLRTSAMAARGIKRNFLQDRQVVYQNPGLAE